jgi:prepilin-type N-terminal cleavage/methylation domain-containing protein
MRSKLYKCAKGFSLMELMIVIVIIGILAAGGVMIFGGGTTKAKIAKSKEGFSKVVEYIAVEMMSCNMGEAKTMSNNLTCQGRTAGKVVTAAVLATKNDQMNPYEVQNDAVTSGGNNTADSDVGYIRLATSGTDIIVKTCVEVPCSTTANQSIKTIPLQ